MSSIDLYFGVPYQVGWTPIVKMGELLNSYLNANFIDIDVNKSLHRTTKLGSLVPRKNKRGGWAT